MLEFFSKLQIPDESEFYFDFNKKFCSICKKYVAKSQFPRHTRNLHALAKNFICGVCNRRFSESWNMKKHIRSRHGQNADDKNKNASKLDSVNDDGSGDEKKDASELGVAESNQNRPYPCENCKRR